jgi:hypothetical protein
MQRLCTWFYSNLLEKCRKIKNALTHGKRQFREAQKALNFPIFSMFSIFWTARDSTLTGHIGTVETVHNGTVKGLPVVHES